MSPLNVKCQRSVPKLPHVHSAQDVLGTQKSLVFAMKYVAFFVCSVRITCGEVEPNENRVFRYRRSLVTEINMAEYGDT